MSRLSKDSYYLQMLGLVAARSTCMRRAVGAIVTDVQGRILGVGYNGTPRGWTHCADVPCVGATDPAGDSSRCYAVHAEVNALIQCYALHLVHTMYVSCTPCFTCAKMIVNVGVRRVVCAERYVDDRGERLFLGLGVQLEFLPLQS